VDPPRPPPPAPWREDEEHYFNEFKRFRAAGHEPPVPPVGGNITFTTSTSFNINQRFFKSEEADNLV
jgi:hypothetical protein